MGDRDSLVIFDPSLELMIEAWLHAKAQRSHSEATVRRYKRALSTFRALLHSQGADLDGPTALIATLAQGWAAMGRQHLGVSPATYNNRLAVLSSFYAYVIRQGLFVDEEKHARENPITRIDRSPIQPYANAQALAYSTVKARLGAIDTSTLEGLRDHCILWLALTLGRRLSEIAGMRRDDITSDSMRKKIHFPRTKGGKQAWNLLTVTTSGMLGFYLASMDAQIPKHDPETVWVALGPHHRGGPLSARSLERICEQRLGTSHFHALRHTFAHALEERGAKISEIQALLGHSNIATTGRYLASLSSEVNPYAEAIDAMFFTSRVDE